ncbi:MAG: ABC transporter substrate-binding protein [Brevibacterium sp.]|uniref:siderophore ABC transporter substrate-binding protein n=1 Tax=Brevibacterium sp. TaxID=1701 RepID=UPI0026471C2E|nr:ABC transporter substrate-binding protein [Brevibacterium sp.]MDN5808118.1 ABC transporter substrate-binding protein [Brevibacterium sp.]MDN5834077.1 ABC transporter substrate-binding protein [Brevibacterium sp.]MDN6135202.1 ABC transporter substrate-binding protein [Brevibacterium sp.]MDN6157434.1 ABC transporter substrate-binding protein [Brevibacterium sp.]MDN6176519.1 ABC transporter substrate-binding protein [Brevibacterium sp.]
MVSSRLRFTALAGVVALALAGCGQAAADDTGADAKAGSTIDIEDNNGAQSVASPPASVVATDNRTFETLDAWDIELSAAAVSLMSEDLSYTKDDSVLDLGSHREPDLEKIVEAKPDLVINGQRFAQFHDDLAKLAPEATVLELDPRDGEDFGSELKRQTTVLGEIFGKQDDAQKIIDDYDASVKRAKAAYDSKDTAMGLITSAGDIGYSAPSVGRTVGPVFDILGLNPALDVEASSEDHQGDDISVEAIADSKPELMVVLDRDASFAPEDRDEGSAPAAEVLEDSEALTDVPAIKDDKIVYFPQDTYLNEGIQTYTEFFNSFADQLEEQK